MQPAVFLDRDNTLIHNDGDLGDPVEVRLMQGAASAVASLCGLGYKVIVITNQGGVARGKFTEQDVHATHERVSQLLQEASNGARVDRFYYCPYHPEGTVKKYAREHPNRKPSPGMLLDAARDLKLDLSRSWTIGDQMRDVQAGAAAGTRTILLRDDARQRTPLDVELLTDVHDDAPCEPPKAPNHDARTLIEAVRIIAQKRKPGLPGAGAGAGVLETVAPPRREHKWDAAAVAELQKAPVTSTRSPTTPTQTKPFRPWNVLAEPTETESAAAAQPAVEKAPSEPVVATKPKPTEVVTKPPSPTTSTTDKTLKQILQELRHQRGSEPGEFSYLTITAIVMQMVAGVCLLGGLWMGAENFDLFMRWILSGLIIQGSTLALLLFSHHR